MICIFLCETWLRLCIFCIKHDCLLFPVNVTLFFEFLRETVFRRGIGDPNSMCTSARHVLGARYSRKLWCHHGIFKAKITVGYFRFAQCRVFSNTHLKDEVRGHTRVIHWRDETKLPRVVTMNLVDNIAMRSWSKLWICKPFDRFSLRPATTERMYLPPCV